MERDMKGAKMGHYYGLDKKTWDLAIFAANKSLAMGFPASPQKIQYLLWEIDGACFSEYGVRYLSEQWKSTVFGPQIEGVRMMYGLWGCESISRPITHDDYEPPEKPIRDMTEEIIRRWSKHNQHDMRNAFTDALPRECFKETTSDHPTNLQYPMHSVCGV